MTPVEFKNSRAALGVSGERLKAVMQVGDERTVRRWESGASPVPGPVAVLMDAILHVRELRIYLGLPEHL